MDSNWIPIVSSAITGIIVRATSVITCMATNKANKRKAAKEFKCAEVRHRQKLVFTTAVEKWKVAMDAVKVNGNSVLPLDLYALHMVKLRQVLDQEDTTATNIAERLREVNDFVDAAEIEVSRHNSNHSRNA